MKSEYGVKAPASMGSMSNAKLGRSVIDCIKHNRADAILMRGIPRLVVAIQILMPRFYELICRLLDTAALFRTVAKSNLAKAHSQ